MEKSLNKSETRSFLMRKLLTICPVCKKMIFGRDITLIKQDKSKINHWPLHYVHFHEHNGFPKHSIILYLDSNFSVRNLEIKKYIKK